VIVIHIIARWPILGQATVEVGIAVWRFWVVRPGSAIGRMVDDIRVTTSLAAPRRAGSPHEPRAGDTGSTEA